MVNRSGVGPAFARVRGLVFLAVLVLGAGWLLTRDIAAPHSKLPSATSSQLRASLAQLPISFEPNQGQSDSPGKVPGPWPRIWPLSHPSEAVLTVPRIGKSLATG